MAIKPLAIVLLSLFLVVVSGSIRLNDHQHPEERFRECQQECDREIQHRPECRQQCAEELRRRQQEQQHEGGGGGSTENNPYVFEEQHFTSQLRTEHGRIQILQKFTERSNLLRGIENYRVSIFEAEPQTFVVPNHWDADAVFFVANGKGSISLVFEDKRESVNLRRGDVFRVPAGITVYLVNNDNRERLVLFKLLRTVSTSPGELQTFFGAGGENPESFYKAFSNDLLAAALNINGDRVQKLFGQQRQGIMIKASEEQIRSMSHHQEGGIWPFGGKSSGTKGPFNLLRKDPRHSNEYGQLHEVDADDFSPLEDLNVAISFANISRGGMTGPFYNSEATKIAMVIKGEGELQMACPHLSESQWQGRGQGQQGQEQWQGRGQGQEQWRGQGQGQGQGQWPGQGQGQGPSYQGVRARLRQGTVFVQPPGHPAALVSSQNQNLEVICFEINARNNRKFPLAGKGNVINKLESVAQELAFGVPAREVEEVFGKQDNEYFFKGPGQQRQQGIAYA